MRNGELLYDSARHRDSAFLRAMLVEGVARPETVAGDLNTWVVRVRARVQGSAGSGPVLRELLDGLSRYGFSAKAIQAMCERFPNLLCMSWGNLHGSDRQPGKLILLERYGFTREQLRRMCQRFPALLNYGWDRTCGDPTKPGLLLLLERYGFTRPQVISLCRHLPMLLGYSWQRTHGDPGAPGLLLQFEAWGLSRKQVIDLCVRVPILLSCRWQRTVAQLQLARQLSLRFAPELFLFSPAKTGWRWHFLIARQGLCAGQARSALFVSHRGFVRRFGEDYQ